MNSKNVAYKFGAIGVVGVIRTDTVYGIAARASDQRAVAKLYKLKSRENKPGTLIAASIDQVAELGIKRKYLKAVEEFWPSSISVILPCPKELDYLDQGVGSLAIRVVSDPRIVELLNITGPLITSSANQPGEQPAKNIEEAKNYFDNNVDFYVDDGPNENAKASTIIRIIDDAVDIVRQGDEIINL